MKSNIENISNDVLIINNYQYTFYVSNQKPIIVYTESIFTLDELKNQINKIKIKWINEDKNNRNEHMFNYFFNFHKSVNSCKKIEMTKMYKAIVKWFDSIGKDSNSKEKHGIGQGYLTIVDDKLIPKNDGLNDIHLHYSNIINKKEALGKHKLKRGDIVELQIGEYNGKTTAINVKRLFDNEERKIKRQNLKDLPF